MKDLSASRTTLKLLEKKCQDNRTGEDFPSENGAA